MLAGLATLVAGCAVPSAGRASYEPPRVVGSVANTGADADKPAATSSSRHSRRPHPEPHRSSAPTSSAPRTPPTTTTTVPPRIPPAIPTSPAPPRTHRPPATHAPAPHDTAQRPGSKVQSPSASLPEFAVCLNFYQLARKPSADFRSLPTHASQQARTTVARSFSKAHAGMAKVLQRSGLPRRDVVYARGSEVAQAVSGIAQALPTGQGVTDRRLRKAFANLTTACAR
ncbi:MAG TPA: hypothetical protein VHX59_23620 [Mycobacteriales bacterium]|nr:hypothetical protein [Mycobacteriales bacterium]